MPEVPMSLRRLVNSPKVSELCLKMLCNGIEMFWNQCEHRLFRLAQVIGLEMEDATPRKAADSQNSSEELLVVPDNQYIYTRV